MDMRLQNVGGIETGLTGTADPTGIQSDSVQRQEMVTAPAKDPNADVAALLALPDVTPEQAKQAAKDASAFDKTMAVTTGFNRGVEKFTSFVTDSLVSGIFGEKALEKDIASQKADFLKQQSKLPTHTNLGELGGEILTSGVIAYAASPLAIAKNLKSGKAAIEGVTSLGGKTGLAAADLGVGSAVAGGIKRPGDEESRLENAVEGGLLGAAVGGLAKGVSGIGKIGKESEEFLQQASEYGVTVVPRDLSRKGTQILADKISGYIPSVTKAKLVEKRMDEFGPAIERFISKVSSESTGDINNIGTILHKASARMKAQVGSAYDDVDKLAKADGAPVFITDLKETATKLSSELKGSLTENTATTNLLDKISKMADNQSFNEVRKLRTQIGELVSSSARGTDTTSQRVWKQAYGATMKSLDDFGYNTHNKELAEAYHSASAQYKGYAEIFKNPQMKNALADDVKMWDYVNKLISEKNPLKVERTMSGLSEAEQATVRSELVADAFSKATTEIGGKSMIDVSKFINTINPSKSVGATKALWGPQYNKMLGFKNLMEVAGGPMSPRASSTIADIAQGSVATAAAGMIGGAGSIGIPLVSAGVFARIMHSPKAAQMLLRWSQIDPVNVSKTTAESLTNASLQMFKDAIKKGTLATGITAVTNP